MIARQYKMTWFGTAVLAVALFVSVGTASADRVSLPAVNLGDTSFFDGVAYPGWLVEETFGYYHAGKVKDPRGDKVAGSNKITAVSATTHVAYICRMQMLGGYYGAELLLPLVDLDVDTQFGPKQRKQGTGDLIVSPFILQWNDHKLFGMPYFHRVVLDVTLPTGGYESKRPVNTGNNAYNINPYYAFTVIPSVKTEFSARFHYLWNSKNQSPFDGSGLRSTQPGQAFHANYAASYEVIPGVHLGLNGYVLQQLTEDKADGQRLAGSKERVFGIGPGLQIRSGSFSLYLNSYFETGAENRSEGTKTVLRLSKGF